MMDATMDNMKKFLLVLLTGCLLSPGLTTALQSSPKVSRRSVLLSPSAAALSFLQVPSSASAAADLVFSTTPTGLQWADAKVGSGVVPQKGSNVAIDYVMSTTGARYGTKIYSTADRNAPYRWVLGDGSTIPGLEEAVSGGDGISPMMPGGIRRVIIPANLGYAPLAKPLPGQKKEDCEAGKGIGPIPPITEDMGNYQRFKNIYCNPNIPYQPDLVMDIKLYGKRTS